MRDLHGATGLKWTFRITFVPATLLALICLDLAPARAQLVRSDYLEQAPIELARDAFSSGYGVILATEFGAILRESADPACLAAKSIDPAQLSDRGKDILVRYGAQMIQVIVETVDMT